MGAAKALIVMTALLAGIGAARSDAFGCGTAFSEDACAVFQPRNIGESLASLAGIQPAVDRLGSALQRISDALARPDSGG